MSTDTPALSFAQFGETIERTFIQSWHHKAHRSEMETLSATFCSIILRAGLRGALNRLLPESIGIASVNSGGMYWNELKLGDLRIARSREFGAMAHEANFIITGNHGSPHADQFDIFLDTKVGLIAPGPWLKTIEEAANKKPEHRHESPAAFQRFLRHG